MSISWQDRLSEGRIVPHYQPIVSVESLTVAAYEALGRHAIGPEVRSLGPFFETAATDPRWLELHREIDRSLRRTAITEFATVDSNVLLFLNVTPRLMVEHLTERPNERPWTLKILDEVGLDPRRVVIELTEDGVGEKTESLRRLVDNYRAYGCSIAIDDVGARSSNLDRLGYFEPDLIKIDALMLRRSLRERSFRQVLRGLGTMAEGLGASLVFEGVETEEELHQALRFGARYVQGWYFAKAQPDLVPPDRFVPTLRPVIEAFGRTRGVEASNRADRVELVLDTLGTETPQVLVQDEKFGLDRADLNRWDGVACRAFLTDLSGFQVSPNYERTASGWVENWRAWGRCRSSRPYFPGPQGIGKRSWSVSSVYYDLNDRSLLRTYGRPLGRGCLLFVDVPEIEKQT